jgi:hypothetical protein
MSPIDSNFSSREPLKACYIFSLYNKSVIKLSYIESYVASSKLESKNGGFEELKLWSDLESLLKHFFCLFSKF